MISRFLSLVILVPLGILIVVFCVANRSAIPVSLDPFGTLPQYVFQIPLFLVIMASLIAGVVLGGIGTFLTQGHYRRTAWKRKHEVERLKREAEDARERLRLEREARTAIPMGPASTALAAPRH